jgi:hypothetical protein
MYPWHNGGKKKKQRPIPMCIIVKNQKAGVRKCPGKLLPKV